MDKLARENLLKFSGLFKPNPRRIAERLLQKSHDEIRTIAGKSPRNAHEAVEVFMARNILGKRMGLPETDLQTFQYSVKPAGKFSLAKPYLIGGAVGGAAVGIPLYMKHRQTLSELSGMLNQGQGQIYA